MHKVRLRSLSGWKGSVSRLLLRFEGSRNFPGLTQARREPQHAAIDLTDVLYRISTIIASHASARSERSKSQAHVVREWGSFKGVREEVRRERRNNPQRSEGMERASSRNGKGGSDMKNRGEKGAAGYIAAWALGVPVSILLIVFLLRGCT